MIAMPVTASLGTCIDTNFKLGAATAKGLRAAGVGTVVRYVYYHQAPPGDIDARELSVLLDAGLVVVLVQHPRSPTHNILGAETGRSDADWAVTNALAASYDPALAKAPLWLVLDMEGVANPGAGSVAHATTWCERVQLGGFKPAVYLGYCSGLSSADCDTLPGNPAFWCDAGPYSSRPSPARHFAWKQRPQSKIAGVDVDVNDVLQDGAIVGIGDEASVKVAA